MYPYTKELTLDEAHLLPERITVYSPITKQDPLDELSVFNLSYIYNNNNAVYCTALDYATHILQAAPPEGWGYAAYELSSGKYEGLHYRSQPSGTSVFRFENQENTDKWWYYQFKLTDLARVEGISEMETSVTDWEAKYKELEDRLLDAQNCIAVQEAKYNEVVKAAKNAIDAQEYQINRLQHYSDQREKAVLSITSFYHLINN